MKFQEWLMNEMPINKFQLLGNWDKGKKYGYSDQDIGILTNPKAVEKIHRKWSNTKDTFDLYFLRSHKGFKGNERGEISPDKVKELFDVDIQPDPNNITVLFLNNIAGDKMPMNSWTIAHRMGHALGYSIGNDKIEILERELKYDFTEILEHIYDRENKLHRGRNYEIESKIEKDILNLAYAICSFKSARDRKINSFYELIYELLAQYINNGRIKFNPLPKYLMTKKRFAWGKPNHSYYKSNTDEDNLEAWNDHIQGLSVKYESMFGSIFKKLKGKILVM